jgi:hypothetical protein
MGKKIKKKYLPFKNEYHFMACDGVIFFNLGRDMETNGW